MIQSDRIYLEKLCEDDFELFKEVYTDPFLMKYVGPTIDEGSIISNFNATIKSVYMQPPKSIFMTINNLNTNHHIGLTGLKINPSNRNSASIGVIIRKKFIRNSYAIEAMSLIIEYAFNKTSINRIIAHCDINNNPIHPIMQKLGFRNSGETISKKNNLKSYVWIIEKTI